MAIDAVRRRVPAHIATAATTAATGTKVTPVNERDALPEMKRMIASATKSIDIIAYNFFSESGDVKALAEQLIAKKRDHPEVRVRVILEGDHGAAAARNLKTAELLRAAGIEVVLDSPKMVTHAKGIVVDGKIILAGSTNLTNTSLGKNNEVNLKIESRTLAKHMTKWLDDVAKDPGADHTTTHKSGHVTMLTDRAYKDALIDMIDRANHTLKVSMYYVALDDASVKEIMAALERAQGRCVDIKMYLEQSNADFAPTITKANLRARKALMALGIDVVMDPAGKISHAKVAVRDGEEVLLGSTNWSEDDFDKRHQVNWRVEDPAIAGAYDRWIDDKRAHDSEPPLGA